MYNNTAIRTIPVDPVQEAAEVTWIIKGTLEAWEREACTVNIQDDYLEMWRATIYTMKRR